MAELAKPSAKLQRLAEEQSVNLMVLCENLHRLESSSLDAKDAKKTKTENRALLRNILCGARILSTDEHVIREWVSMNIANEGGLEAVQASINASTFTHATNRYIDARIDTAMYADGQVIDGRLVPSLDPNAMDVDMLALISGRSTDILRAAKMSGIADFLNVPFWLSDDLTTVQFLIRTGRLDTGLKLPASPSQIEPHSLDKMVLMPAGEKGEYAGFMPVKSSALVIAHHTAHKRAQEVARAASIDAIGDPTQVIISTPMFVGYINNPTNAGALLNRIAGTSLYPLVLPWTPRSSVKNDSYRSMRLLDALHKEGVRGAVKELLSGSAGKTLRDMKNAIFAAQKHQGLAPDEAPRLNMHLHELLYAAGQRAGVAAREMVDQTARFAVVQSWTKDRGINNLDDPYVMIAHIWDQMAYDRDAIDVWRDGMVQLVMGKPDGLHVLTDQYINVVIESIIDGFYQVREADHIGTPSVREKRTQTPADIEPLQTGKVLALRLKVSDCDLHSNGLSAGIPSMTGMYGFLHNILQRELSCLRNGFKFLPIYHRITPQLGVGMHYDRVRHFKKGDEWVYSPLYRKIAFPYSTSVPLLHGTGAKAPPRLTDMRGELELTILVSDCQGGNVTLTRDLVNQLEARLSGARLLGGMIHDYRVYWPKDKARLPAGHVLEDVSTELGDNDWLMQMYLSNMIVMRNGGLKTSPVRALPQAVDKKFTLERPFGFTLVGYSSEPFLETKSAILKHKKGDAFNYRWAVPMHQPVAFCSTRLIEITQRPLPWVEVSEKTNTVFELTFAATKV